MSFELRQINDWSYYYLPELEKAGIVQGFFTKESPSHTFMGKDRTSFSRNFLATGFNYHGPGAW